MLKLIISVLFYLSFTIVKAQPIIQPYGIGYEKLKEKPENDHYKIIEAWLPDSTQIIIEGNGYREYEVGGEIRRYYYRNGIASGLVLFTDLTRTRIMQIGYYQGDVKYGTWMRFYPNGQIASSVTFDSGHVVSEMTLFYENAAIKARSHVNDKVQLDGYYYEYFESGKIKSKGQYAIALKCKMETADSSGQSKKWNNNPMSIQVGLWIDYYENGQVKKEYSFDSTCILLTNTTTNENSFTASSTKVQECPIGTWIEYDETGNVLSIVRYKDCLKIEEENIEDK